MEMTAIVYSIFYVFFCLLIKVALPIFTGNIHKINSIRYM